MDFTRVYDYNGNPLYTEYGHKTTRSELYGTQAGQDPEGPADALNRLTRFRRGTLNGNKDDLTAVLFEQDWHDTAGALTLDKLGNWDLVRQQPEGGEMATITRGHNAANEVARPLLAEGSVVVPARPPSWSSKRGTAAPAYAHGPNGNLTDDRSPSPSQEDPGGYGPG